MAAIALYYVFVIFFIVVEPREKRYVVWMSCV